MFGFILFDAIEAFHLQNSFISKMTIPENKVLQKHSEWFDRFKWKKFLGNTVPLNCFDSVTASKQTFNIIEIEVHH
jgi:hypothetical protein